MEDLNQSIQKNKSLRNKKPVALPVSLPIQQFTESNGSTSDLKRGGNRLLPDINPIKVKIRKQQVAEQSGQQDGQNRSVASSKVNLNTATIFNDQPNTNSNGSYSKSTQTSTTSPSYEEVDDRQTQISGNANNVNSLRNIRKAPQSSANKLLNHTGTIDSSSHLQLSLPRIPYVVFSRAVQTVEPPPEPNIPVATFSREVQTDGGLFITQEEYDRMQLLNSLHIDYQQLIDYVASENNNVIQTNIEVREELRVTTASNQPAGTNGSWRQSRRLHQYQDIAYPNGMPTERIQNPNYVMRSAHNDMPNAMYLARRPTMPMQVPTSRQRPPISLPISPYEQFYNYRNPQMRYNHNPQVQYPQNQPAPYTQPQNRQYHNMVNITNMVPDWSYNIHQRVWP